MLSKLNHKLMCYKKTDGYPNFTVTDSNPKSHNISRLNTVMAHELRSGPRSILRESFKIVPTYPRILGCVWFIFKMIPE